MIYFRFVLLVACLSISLSSFAKKCIKLKGRLNPTGKSIILKHPVEAWLDDNNKDLSLQFYRSFGVVNITVKTTSGKIVYEKYIDTSDMTSYNTALNNIPEGEYILSITNGSDILYGEFSNY